MFARLFSQNGLSLDRLRALVEVGATGSIAQAAGGDPIKQSQYSRQIKELEEFFRTTLIERHGKGVRFTTNGRELARISRFLLMGLSSFQRGCLGEQRTYRIGAGPSFTQTFLLPFLSAASGSETGIRYAVESLPDDLIEQRLHELMLDFGIILNSAPSRPLQSRKLLSWNLRLFVPKQSKTEVRRIVQALKQKEFGFTLAAEMPQPWLAALSECAPSLMCNNFLEAGSLLAEKALPSFLPDYFERTLKARDFSAVVIPFDRLATNDLSEKARARSASQSFQYSLAWNPRLLRLNPQAVKQLDWLQKGLA